MRKYAPSALVAGSHSIMECLHAANIFRISMRFSSIFAGNDRSRYRAGTNIWQWRPYCKPADSSPEMVTEMVPVQQSTHHVKSISEIISSANIVLFMKGTPELPLCGFSKKAINILSLFPVKDMIAIDVLEEPSLREMVKEFTGWPTISQLFIKGEFIGGCDILTEMYGNGDLERLLREKALL